MIRHGSGGGDRMGFDNRPFPLPLSECTDITRLRTGTMSTQGILPLGLNVWLRRRRERNWPRGPLRRGYNFEDEYTSQNLLPP